MAHGRTLQTQFPSDYNGNPLPCSESTGLIPVAQAPKVVTNNSAALVDCLLYTDGLNDAVLTVFDGVDASGKVLAKVIAKGAELWGGEVNIMCEAHGGIYMTLTGAGSSALLRYIDIQ